MKKVLLSLGVICVFSGYAIYQHLNSAPPVVSINTPAAQTNQSSASQNPPDTSTQTQPAAKQPAASAMPTAINPTPTPASAPTPTPAPAAVAKNPAGQYKDGTYTGSVADAFYGGVQVAAVISGGRLTDVQILQYPTDRGHSAQIGQQAMPILKSEAIASQSANVDIVSGATQDSQAFEQSLQSALSQAM